MGIMRLPRLTPRALFKHSDAARQALEICAIADSMAQEAMQCVDSNEERLYELIERRDEVLQSLAEHLVSLRLEKHAADSPLIASSERAADEGDELVDAVCAALDVSQRTTMALAARVASRVAELRAELATVQKAGSVQMAYLGQPAVSHLDSRR
jgi:hypothetical protein